MENISKHDAILQIFNHYYFLLSARHCNSKCEKLHCLPIFTAHTEYGGMESFDPDISAFISASNIATDLSPGLA